MSGNTIDTNFVLPTFEQLVEASHNRSVEFGTVDVLGALADPTARQNWRGGISLDCRLEDGSLKQEDLQEALSFIGQCYVVCDPNSPTRCIDGRIILGYEDTNPEHFGLALGPQVPGGDVGLAVAWRLAVGLSSASEENYSLENDVEKMIASGKLDFQPGNHVDDSHPEGKTGCRAVDGVEDHLDDISPATFLEIEAFEKAMLGDDFSDAALNNVLATSVRLLARKKEYFKDKQVALEHIVKSSPEGLAVLTGQHKEIIFSINTVPNETLHGYHFASRFGGEVQAFNYDIWRSFTIARSVFPNEPELQSNFLHARLAMALSTAMDLTDGSLILTIRRAKQ